MGELCQINGEKIQGEMGAKQKKQGGDCLVFRVIGP